MRRRLFSILAVALALAASCGGDPAPEAVATPTPADGGAAQSPTTAAPVVTMSPVSDTTAPPSTPPPPTTGAKATVEHIGFPVVVDHDAGSTVVPHRPARIAALSATHIEMLFALGAGPQVIAGDLFSDYPPDETASLSLVDSFNLNVEAVIDLGPDLVVLSFDPGGAVDALETVGIPVLLLGTALDLEAVYRQIETLGRATGNAAGAAELETSMRDEITTIVSDAAATAAGVTFYHESDPFSYYTPNSQSFIGSLYAMLGMINIADAAPDELASGFPQLSPEFIVASDPDVVYLAGFGETPETFEAREGWETMTAVAAGRVVVLDPDVASRWGPRVVDLLRAIAAGASQAAEERQG